MPNDKKERMPAFGSPTIWWNIIETVSWLRKVAFEITANRRHELVCQVKEETSDEMDYS